MPFYSQDNLIQLQHNYVEVQDKADNLQIQFARLTLTSARAREYATQGFSRRIRIMKRCIYNVFAAIPPEREEPPSSEDNADATINIQAFLINVFGSLDNLAWIWVSEKNVSGQDGSPLSNKQVGLSPGYRQVRRSFPPELREYLDTLGDWFKGMGKFRDALAHRISPYIAPYAIPHQNRAAFDELQARIEDAAQRGSAMEYLHLVGEQEKARCV